MATTSIQTELNLIQQKKTLYSKRIEDARKKNRPDIEKIWLDEIKVLDEKKAKLLAKQKGKVVEKPDDKLTAKQERKLRQLNNQIQYVERKISIHRERGETAAVQKQTALLLGLQAKREKLIKATASKTKSSTATSTTAKGSAQVSTTKKSEVSNLSSVDKKKLNGIEADIAHADKMIREYKKFKSPKADVWVGKKFQLVAKRDKLLQGSTSSASTTAETVPPARKSTPSSLSAQPDRQITAQEVAQAQDTNNQVRIIDLEIAHANKMISEYQKYKSPKANQWIHRKNELVARRGRITGKVSRQNATPAKNAANQKRIQIIVIKLGHAEKMIKEYQKYNSPKQHEWIERRNDLLAEKAQLEGGRVPNIVQPPQQTGSNNSQAIKNQIAELNRQAKDADTNMRAALKRGDHQQANRLHQQRDQFNQRARQLTAQLSGGASSQNRRPPPLPKKPNVGSSGHTSGSGSAGAGRVGTSSALEKSIAQKYLHTRNYTNEHAYKEIIETLLTQREHQHLQSAKETLYDITNASQLPARGTTINTPYIRDCFKIKVSGVRLDGYTINDTIFDTSFPRDFDAMVARINTHVMPAPVLKPYVDLAHRDAIQLIPSDRRISKYNSQFAGAMLKDISIRNISVYSKGALQGLFASDGSFKNLHMENITVQTNSAHQIAILGLLSGTLDLSSPNGKPIHVNLLPLRLAGGHNIYINSFSRSSSYQYGKVDAGRSNAVINDNRRNMNKRGTYYKNFNMDEFFAAMRRADQNTNIITRIKEAAKRAGTVAKVV